MKSLHLKLVISLCWSLVAAFCPMDDVFANHRPNTELLQRDQANPEDAVYDEFFPVPACDFHTCSSPELVEAYASYFDQGLLEHLTLEYVVHVFAEDDGSSPWISVEEFEAQAQSINEGFQEFNITWSGNMKVYNNSTMKNYILIARSVPIECTPDMIGDGVCHDGTDLVNFCNSISTGYDGGDCRDVRDEVNCSVSQQGNGVCDEDCNFKIFDWDGGDCCDTAVTNTWETCRDPRSVHRNWISSNDYKRLVNSSGKRHLNVYIARFSPDFDAGAYATYPYAAPAIFLQKNYAVVERGVLGGVTSQPSFYGKPDLLLAQTHEFGHMLSLYHTHTYRGLSFACSSPCKELQVPVGQPSSAITGDMIADTRATPENYFPAEPATEVQCADSSICTVSASDCSQHLNCSCTGCATQATDPGFVQDCQGKKWVDTPLTNYMGYSCLHFNEDSCVPTFTRLQIARSRCTIDRSYQGWTKTSKPSPIVIPPFVEVLQNGTIGLKWPPPMGFGNTSNINDLNYRIFRSPGFCERNNNNKVTSSRVIQQERTFLDTNAAHCANVSGTNFSYAIQPLNKFGEAILSPWSVPLLLFPPTLTASLSDPSSSSSFSPSPSSSSSSPTTSSSSSSHDSSNEDWFSLLLIVGAGMVGLSLVLVVVLAVFILKRRKLQKAQTELKYVAYDD